MLRNFREPISGLTHLFGVCASIVGLIVLLLLSVNMENIRQIITFSIFGLSLILLYTASTVYHLSTSSEKVIRILRRIDHSMIYILIAGSYTPICLIALRGVWGWSILTIIWSLAIIGVLVKNFWFNAPKWLSTLGYILMGWLIIVAIYPLTKVFTGAAMIWLVLGGISYTIGGIIYALEWPKLNFKYFGSHEIFHIFILMGSFCHYWLMFKYILYL